MHFHNHVERHCCPLHFLLYRKHSFDRGLRWKGWAWIGLKNSWGLNNSLYILNESRVISIRWVKGLHGHWEWAILKNKRSIRSIHIGASSRCFSYVLNARFHEAIRHKVHRFYFEEWSYPQCQIRDSLNPTIKKRVKTHFDCWIS